MIKKRNTDNRALVAALLTGWMLVAVAQVPATPARAAAPMIPQSFSELAEKARPGVVNIRTVKKVKGGGRVFRHFFGNPFGGRDPFRDFFGPFQENDPSRDFKQRSLGSGFLFDAEGYIVTNNHVIEGADQIKVKLSNEDEYEAKVVGRDPNTDLALIKIDGAKNLKPLKLGDSESLKVGQWVVAIGSPFGLEQTVTQGIVSAKKRVIGSGPYDDFIQTDASINPGNSGGPLLNLTGEVVGINTAIIASGQGIGFAIPVNMARKIISQLRTDGEVRRGWLGVGIQDLTDELAEYYGIDKRKGVVVIKVYEGDPADKAGIRPRDVIVSVDGKPVTSTRELSGAIANLGEGRMVAIILLRDGREKTVRVKLTRRDDERLLAERRSGGENGGRDELGLRLADLDAQTARQFGYRPDDRGVLVVGVEPESKAAEGGVRQGDLIREVNREAVGSVDDFRERIRQADPNQPLGMLIQRGDAGFVAVKIQR